MRHTIVLLLIMGLLVLLSGPAPAGSVETPSTMFSFQSGSRVTIEGSSTVTDWSCRSTDVMGFVKVGLSWNNINRLREQIRSVVAVRGDRTFSQPFNLSLTVEEELLPSAATPPRARLALPISSFDCGNPAMNEDMYEALKHDKQPAILYELYNLQKVKLLNPAQRPSSYRLSFTGALALAAHARTVHLKMAVVPVSSRTFKVQGSQSFRMTDFRIKPPSAFFGLIKAYDEITLHFDLVLEAGRNDGRREFLKVAEKSVRELDSRDWLAIQ